METALHVLFLLQNRDGWNAPEREIDRRVLVSAAPDREELLVSKTPINEIRQILKIGTGSSIGHDWLYRVQRRNNVRLKDATRRLSFFSTSVDARCESCSSATDTVFPDHQAQNIPSESTSRTNTFVTVIDPMTGYPPNNISNTLLVSPRELGPTHILMAYSGASQTHESRSGSPRVQSVYSETLEMPINDLLFILNVPNLSYNRALGQHAPVLPQRRDEELPLVMLPVPHLKTFHELVIYLHTKNQAALFRALIPEWARDIMHPLPPSTNTRDLRLKNNALEEHTSSVFCCIPTSQSRSGSGRFFNKRTDSSSILSASAASIPSTLNPTRSIISVSVEISQAAEINTTDVVSDPLNDMAVSLDCLKDNLLYIGYIGDQELWAELHTYQKIFRRAISHQARISITSR